jgi:hypothetical protein
MLSTSIEQIWDSFAGGYKPCLTDSKLMIHFVKKCFSTASSLLYSNHKFLNLNL